MGVNVSKNNKACFLLLHDNDVSHSIRRQSGGGYDRNDGHGVASDGKACG